MTVSLRYSDNDYTTLRDQLIDIVPTLTDNWTDFNDSDVSMVLLDLAARLGDYSSFRRDKIVRELLLPRAKERKNVKALLSLIGYKMHSYIASSCEATFSIAQPKAAAIYIPNYSSFSIVSSETGDEVLFSNLKDLTLYAGETSKDLVLTQGEVKSYSYSLDDLIDGRLYLPDEKIAMNTIRLTTRANSSSSSLVTTWEEVEDIIEVENSGTYFSHDQTDENKEYVDLHPIYQNMLTDDSVITVDYLITLGEDGFVGANKVVEVLDSLVDMNGNEVADATITNITAAGGGSDPEDIDRAKRNARVFVKTMETIVTLEDYKNFLETHNTVLRALALDWNFPESGLSSGFEVNVYVVPSEGSVVDELFVQKLKDYINPRRYTGVKVNIVEASYLNVNIGITAYVRKNSLFKDRVRTNATKALQDMFNLENLDFGQAVYLSELTSSQMLADPEIVKVVISGVDSDIEPGMTQVIKLGTYDVQVMEV